MKLLKFLGERNPIIYAIIYIALVFISAFFICNLNIFELTSTLDDIDETSFLTSLYFSFITITTLGYGDILPANLETRCLVMLLSFSGVLLIGLFLNSLAYKIFLFTKEDERKEYEKNAQQTKINNFLGIKPILLKNFEEYFFMIYSLTTQEDKINKGISIDDIINSELTPSDFRSVFFESNYFKKYFSHKSNINIYYQIYDRLYGNLNDFLKLGYFSFDEKVMSDIILYLTECIQIDIRDSTLISIKDKEIKAIAITMNELSTDTHQIHSELELNTCFIVYLQIELTINLYKKIANVN